jgi:hypothetical protein
VVVRERRRRKVGGSNLERAASVEGWTRVWGDGVRGMQRGVDGLAYLLCAVGLHDTDRVTDERRCYSGVDE